MAQEFKSLVGIDVSEDRLEVCVLPQATRGASPRKPGWQALAEVVAERRRRWW